MIFVDASALVAIVAEEADGPDHYFELLREGHRATSPVAIYEAALAIRRIRSIDLREAVRVLLEFLAANEFDILPLTVEDGLAALSAFGRYGKGEGRPGKLNMGDCFAYGMAGRRGHRLLYKGTDFAETDLGRI
jgi:ribonuclease VapC